MTSRLAPAAGEVRIIGGRWKRSKLPVAPIAGLRPTPNRVRETLFNWLGQDLTGLRCLDLFAGTGALGLEAASRGAREVALVERDSTAAAALRQQVQRLGADNVRVHCADARAWLATPTAQWDVVFLDPPFGQAGSGWNAALYREVMQQLQPHLQPQASVYVESAQPWSADQLPALPWRLHRSGHTAAVHYHLFVVDNPAA